ncbi:MAG: hypothetical protein U9Q83_09055 [Bacteroidota bacterium]|nr:hypothetical protein [Bacteroidota bacterium]
MKVKVALILAIVLTLGASIYQKFTGPTYPKKEKIVVEDTDYNVKLIRTHSSTSNAEIILNLPENFNGFVSYRKYPTNDAWTNVEFKRKDDNLFVEIPHQPPAGKLEYIINISYKDKIVFDNSEIPVLIRFKGDVPAYILIPHIIFMFFAMLLSTMTGFLAVFNNSKQKLYGLITLVLLILGGAIFGPIVQKYAFGEFWTGVPLGWDLTDNKTLIALVFWIVAVVANRKEERPVLSVIAAIVLLAIFAIPHSLFGSELDPNSGEVIQGFIFNNLLLF